MVIDILTLFPQMFENVLGESIIRIAQKKKKVRIKVHNLRDWTCDRHRTADDKPYGGGAGMVMKIGPIYGALAAVLGEKKMKLLERKKSAGKGIRIALLSPKGRRFNQTAAKAISKAKRLVLICGHYEGIDERVRTFVTDEISIGDYVLTGGEIPAMVVTDAVSRLIPGVLGGSDSLRHESFENNLLEYPQYTRPREFRGMKVPGILLRGDHKVIESWRRAKAIERTNRLRKDLIQ